MDFTQYMQDGRNYYYQVRAAAKLSERAYVTDGAWVESEVKAQVSRIGHTTGRWRNYQDGNKYELSDGSCACDGWQLMWL